MPKTREPLPDTAARTQRTGGRTLTPPAYGVALADQAPEQGGIRAQENAAIRALSGGRVDLHAMGASIQRVPSSDARLQAVGAHSFAQGTRALVSRDSDRGHELWHLAQQAMGRVRADTVLGGQLANTDSALEREADQMGSRIASFRGPTPAPLAAPNRPAAGPAPVQAALSEEMKARLARRRASFKRIPLEEMRERRHQRAQDASKRLRAERIRAARGLDTFSEVPVEEEPPGFAFTPSWSTPTFGEASSLSGPFSGLFPTTPLSTPTFGEASSLSGPFSGLFPTTPLSTPTFGEASSLAVPTWDKAPFGSSSFGSGPFSSTGFGSSSFGAAPLPLSSSWTSDPFPAHSYRDPEPLWSSGPSFDPPRLESLSTSESGDFGPTTPDPAVDELTAAFESLCITFLDQYGESHAVYPNFELGDAIVESNPTPLKAIIQSGKWEKTSISTADLALLATAQTNIASELAAYGKNRSQTAGKDLKNELKAAAKILKDISNIKLPKTDLSGSTDYLSNTGDTEGKYVIADPLCLNSDVSGSGPQKDSRLMKAIRKAAPGNESKSYFRMHLLNDNVFGPGQLWNLTPGPVASNNIMERGVEDDLKRAVIGAGVVMTFEATANYANDPVAASDTDIDQNPNKYRFQDITFEANQWFADTASMSYKPGTANKDPDVRSIDGARVPWQWGSLTPLVPKPKILSCTVASELTDIGISSTSANKIVAFNGSGTAFALKGKANKETQLANAIHKWETSSTASGGLGKSKAQKINLSGHANDVLWQ